MKKTGITVVAAAVAMWVANAAIAAEQQAATATKPATAATPATPAKKMEAVPGTGGQMQAAPGAITAPPGAITVVKPGAQSATPATPPPKADPPRGVAGATPAKPATPATPATPAAPAAKGHDHSAEHPGQEHPGQGQPGGKGKMEQQSVIFTAPQIKAAMQEYVNTQTAKGNGTFNIHDPVDHKDLNLKLVKIHDPVREVAGKGYFACADFQTTNGSTVYDLDVWLNPRDNKLIPSDTVVHKVNGQARFTYRNDEAVPVK